MVLCKCGCGNKVVKSRRLYIDGHLVARNKDKIGVYNTETIEVMSTKAKERLSNPKNHPMYGKHHTEESKEKNRQSHLGKPSKLKGRKCTEEHIRKNSEAHRKENHHLWGKHRSAETKEKIRIAQIGKIISEDTKNKISNVNKGRVSSNKGKKFPHLTGENNPANRPEVKKKISIANSGKNSGRYGKLPAHAKKFYYDSPLQGIVCFRSSWELKYAQYLDSIKELWYYEIETFDLGDMTYTPDFFLPRVDKFIEIKGFMRQKYQEKINKFLEQYPWDLEILRKDDLIKLGILCK